MDCRDYKHTSSCEILLLHRGVAQNLQKTPLLRTESRNLNDQDWKLFALYEDFLSELSD